MKTVFFLLWTLLRTVNILGDLGPADSQIRLVNGNRQGEGRVEIFLNGQWGTVCDDGWDDTDAKIVCRQLGYSVANAKAYSYSYFGAAASSVPISMTEVSCVGSESSLRSCSYYSAGSQWCGHWEDASVSCDVGSFSDIRLVGGRNPWQGRVEVKRNTYWGTVCDDQWDDTNAAVVCDQLGFRSVEAKAVSIGQFAPGSGPILLDDVRCNGHEFRLWECPATDASRHNCLHSEDAAVDCGDQEEPCEDCEKSNNTLIYILAGVIGPVIIITSVIIVCKCYCNEKKPNVVHVSVAAPAPVVTRPVAQPVMVMKNLPPRRPSQIVKPSMGWAGGVYR